MFGTLGITLGSLAFTGVSLWFKNDPKELGFGVGGNLLASVLSEIPNWMRDRFPRKIGEPNHDLARAFHAAINDTLIYACEGKPTKRFQADCPGAWNSLHPGLRRAVEKWFADLATAATHKSKAGAAPIIPLDDAFLAALLKDNADTALSRLRTLIQTDLQKRLSIEVVSPDTQSTLDDDALQALQEFVAWLCSHLDAQVHLFFLEQLKPTEKGPSPAWISYQFLLGQAMEQHLGEIAGHAVGTRRLVEELVRVLKASNGHPNLSNWPTKEIARLEKGVVEGIHKLGQSLETLHRRFDEMFQQIVELRREMKIESLSRADLEAALASRARRQVLHVSNQSHIGLWQQQIQWLPAVLRAMGYAGVPGEMFESAKSHTIYPSQTALMDAVANTGTHAQIKAVTWEDVLKTVGSRVAVVRIGQERLGAALWINRHHYLAPETLLCALKEAKGAGLPNLEWLYPTHKNWPVQRWRHCVDLKRIELSLHSATPPPGAPSLPSASRSQLCIGDEVAMLVLRDQTKLELARLFLDSIPPPDGDFVSWRINHDYAVGQFEWLPGLPLVSREGAILGITSSFSQHQITIEPQPLNTK